MDFPVQAIVDSIDIPANIESDKIVTIELNIDIIVN